MQIVNYLTDVSLLQWCNNKMFYRQWCWNTDNEAWSFDVTKNYSWSRNTHNNIRTCSLFANKFTCIVQWVHGFQRICTGTGGMHLPFQKGHNKDIIMEWVNYTSSTLVFCQGLRGLDSFIQPLFQATGRGETTQPLGAWSLLKSLGKAALWSCSVNEGLDRRLTQPINTNRYALR